MMTTRDAYGCICMILGRTVEVDCWDPLNQSSSNIRAQFWLTLNVWISCLRTSPRRQTALHPYVEGCWSLP